MKNLYFLLAAGCLVFSQAHADTAYPRAQTKNQAEGLFLSTFWEKTQSSHAFVEVFAEQKIAVMIDPSGFVQLVDSLANASSDGRPTRSAQLNQ